MLLTNSRIIIYFVDLYYLMRNELFFTIATLFTIVSTITVMNSFDIKPSIFNAYATVAGFNVELSGNEEVPPVQTDATGSTELTAPHFENIGYSVNVSNIDKVTAAHIHSGKQGENGPILVTLFKADTPSSEPISGNLASGNITNANLEGPMAGKTVMDLTKSMELGETYVNVHSEEHPNGEIRGQIKGGG
jgi:CHRD domain